jgi:hypothetical protein
VMMDYIKIFLSEKEKLRAMFLITSAQVCLTSGLRCKTLIICVSPAILLIVIRIYTKKLLTFL